MQTITVCEIFHSIQGESTRAGLPCTFIRVSGCNLHCHYCDTGYAREPGTPMTLDSIGKQADAFACPLVEITGGEPLCQPAVPALARGLQESGFQVLVETNGSRDISMLPPGVIRIMDIKTPGSGESRAMDMANLNRLRPGDEVKFVLTGRADYEWARALVKAHDLEKRVPVLLSPAASGAKAAGLPPADLAAWILEDRLQVRLQIQLHKLIWPEERGR